MQNANDYRNSIPGKLTGYDCKKCLNRGGSYVGENTWRVCECDRIRKSLRLIEKSGLLPLMERYTFDKYLTPEPWQATVKEKAQNFLESEYAYCYGIFGQTGSGKTHICTAMSSFYLHKGIPTYYMIWNTDIKRLKSTVNDGEEHEKEVKRLQTVDVLYIDDLFKCKKDSEPTDGDVRLAFEIINARYNAQRTTLISSEFTIDELRMIDAAIAGRIKEMCGLYILNIERNESRNYRWKDEK